MKNLILIIATFLTLGATAQTNEEIEMVTLVNQVRTNPKSFIPIVEAYKASIGKEKYTNKTTGGKIDMVAECNTLISFLKSVKPVSALELSLILYPVTKSQAKYLDSTKQCGHTGPNGQTLLDRTKGLGLLVGENCVSNNGKSITETLIQLLLDAGLKEKSHRANIFNPKYSQISVAKIGSVLVQDFIVKS